MMECTVLSVYINSIVHFNDSDVIFFSCSAIAHEHGNHQYLDDTV